MPKVLWPAISELKLEVKSKSNYYTPSSINSGLIQRAAVYCGDCKKYDSLNHVKRQRELNHRKNKGDITFAAQYAAAIV